MEHVLFLHVPKTGGRSVSALIRNADERCNPANPARFLQDTDWTATRSFRYFFSHAPLYVRQILPVPLFVFTFLRDPVDRAISQYNAILRARATRYNDIVLGQRLSFDDALTHPEMRGGLSNIATRLLGSELDLRALYPDVDLMLAANIATLATPADAFTYRRALKRLGEIDFVGFTERMEADCRALAMRLGIAFETVPHEGRVPEIFDWPLPKAVRCSEVEAAVERHSFFDCRLYEAAHRFFWSRDASLSNGDAREHFGRLADADTATLFGSAGLPDELEFPSSTLDEEARLAAHRSELLRAERLIMQVNSVLDATHKRAGAEIAAREEARSKAEAYANLLQAELAAVKERR